MNNLKVTAIIICLLSVGLIGCQSQVDLSTGKANSPDTLPLEYLLSKPYIFRDMY